jgi:hypothetical protein
MTFSRRACTLSARAAVVLLALVTFVAPAYAKSHRHRRIPASYARRVTKAQSSAISSALLHSTRLERGQLTTEGLCDKPSKDHATCNLEVLAVRRTHRFVHPRVARQHTKLTRATRRGRRPHSSAGADIAPASTPEPSSGTPAWLQQAYDTTWLSANQGTNDTVAIVDAYDDPTAASDLATYRSHFGLPACTQASGCFTVVNQSGKTQAQASSWPTANGDWNLETSMDLDAVSAICPNCHIVLVEATTDGWSDLVTAEGTAANYPGVDQVSDSWGMMVPAAPSPLAFGYPNVSIVASSGDTGYQLSAGPQYPASEPNVVSAGGTTLTTGSVSGYRGFTETTWAGAGSTCDTYVSKPSWQHGACTGRASSDVSADADPNTGLQLYDTAGGGWLQAGGTSLSSPLVAAFEALVQPTAKTGQWAYSDAPLLDDITVGKNDATPSEDLYGTCSTLLVYLCNARAGYDGPTGNGSIDGDVVAGGPGMGGPDCAASSCGSGSSGYASSALTASSATLEAALYPNGLATSYYWQYGTSTGFGNQTGTATATGSSGGVAIKSTLQGLSASTTYYYRLVATNADGTVYGYTFSLTTAAPPANTVSPSVSGTAQQGVLLTANTGTWTPKPTKYSYQWQRNTGSGWSNISGATGQTYRPGAADLAATLDVIVSATDAAGTASATSAATSAVLSGAPVNTTAPTITGSAPKQGVALSVAVGSWSPAATSYSYQWQRNTGSGWIDITGATGNSYTPGTADLGVHLQVQVTGHNAYGTGTATASISGTVATGTPMNISTPTITGTPARLDVLSVSGGSWSPTGTPSYQWERCANSSCSAISGATSSTYTPVLADEGDTLELVVTMTNSYGHASVTTASTAAIAASPPTSAANPSITGTVVEGDTLTAHPGGWGPSDETNQLQWKACSGGSCAAISGATGLTFTLTAAQVGDTIELQVIGTNVDGSVTKVSAQTGVVAA